MSDLAARTLTCTALPFTDDYGNRVAITDGQVHIRLAVDVLPPRFALDLSAALAVAVQITALNHTTPEGA